MNLNPLQAHDAHCLKESSYLVGVDEAGRGALAGPVVASACLIAREFFSSESVLRGSARINDSKQLTAADRETQLLCIENLCAKGWIDLAVAEASVAEIADLNILGATRLAMQRALLQLSERARGWTLPAAEASGPLFQQQPAVVRCLVDGRPLRPFPFLHEGLVKGDSRSLAIAMASIAAKVHRDRKMTRLADQFSGYGFHQHKGYGTKAHREAIRHLGPSPIHRTLFLRKILN
ncbi:MAG: ribonuclease HII [Opitutales bacterium]